MIYRFFLITTHKTIIKPEEKPMRTIIPIMKYILCKIPLTMSSKIFQNK